MKRLRFISIMLMLLLSTLSYGQPGALQLGQLVDTPVAKTLTQGEALTELRMYTHGGILMSVLVGLTDRIGMGVSYGGENIIGAGRVYMNPRPEVHLQYLLFEERFLSPALMLGFQSQGFGKYDKHLKRYDIKSRGLYVVLSKNTSFLGGLGLHCGANWSLENEDKDRDPTVFVGLHKWINPELVLLAEYDSAINDNNQNAIGSGKGYLNTGVQWNMNQQFFFEVNWKNILENSGKVNGSNREVKLYYMVQL